MPGLEGAIPKELLVAVETVVQGKCFVSGALDGHENPATA
jgi:hypothetical protein